MEECYSIKEFAEKANISQQAVYKQLSGRLEPYVILEGKQKKIKAAALAAFYSTHSTNSTQSQTVEQPEVEEVENAASKDNTEPEEEGEKAEVEQPIQPEFNQNSTTVEQPQNSGAKMQSDLELQVEELQEQIKLLLQESAEEKAFLREQIQKKDKQIESLSDSLKMAQQLAAADKKKLLELEMKQQEKKEEVAAASDIQIDLDREPEEQPQKKTFWQRLFGR